MWNILQSWIVVLRRWKEETQDRKILKRINTLLEDIKRNGVMEGIGKPELLKYRSGYSRRIDEVNRLVYDIGEMQIHIYGCVL